MIEKDVPIIPAMLVMHDEGLMYEVDDVRRSTVSYEETHAIGGTVVNYTQLDDGEFPAGTRWQKDEDGFRKHFTVEG